MIALEGNFAYSFLLGVFAAVNPCGFVMLPAYLMYFLGLEGSQATEHGADQRASVRRALVVSAATSAGFIAVFFVVATISRLFTSAIENNAKYAALLIGIALVVMGCFMLAGWRPPVLATHVGEGRQRTRTFGSMFGFGVAYAIASIGCTIGFLVSAIFSSFGTKGFLSGVISVALYGVGMSLLVTALTVTLAFANGGLLRVLRGGLRYMEQIAAVFIIATGFYLAWYWWRAIDERTDADGLTSRVEGWQADVVDFIDRQPLWILIGVLGAIVLAGVAYALWGRQRSADGDDQGASRSITHDAPSSV